MASQLKSSLLLGMTFTDRKVQRPIHEDHMYWSMIAFSIDCALMAFALEVARLTSAVHTWLKTPRIAVSSGLACRTPAVKAGLGSSQDSKLICHPASMHSPWKLKPRTISPDIMTGFYSSILQNSRSPLVLHCLRHGTSLLVYDSKT